MAPARSPLKSTRSCPRVAAGAPHTRIDRGEKYITRIRERGGTRRRGMTYEISSLQTERQSVSSATNPNISPSSRRDASQASRPACPRWLAPAQARRNSSRQERPPDQVCWLVVNRAIVVITTPWGLITYHLRRRLPRRTRHARSRRTRVEQRSGGRGLHLGHIARYAFSSLATTNPCLPGAEDNTVNQTMPRASSTAFCSFCMLPLVYCLPT